MENYKIGYVFDVSNGEFIGTEVVYIERATGLYPHASNVVFVEPPSVKDFEKQVWNGEEWHVVHDYRGVRCWDYNGIDKGIIDKLGDIPKDVVIVQPPEIEHFYNLEWNGSEWISKLKDEYIAEKDGTIRDKTQAEKIIEGLEKCPRYMKIDKYGNLVEKTLEDLFDEGELTVKEYNSRIDEERQSRYEAETDKMGLMYLRGECTLEEWKAAMDQIRKELPKK